MAWNGSGNTNGAQPRPAQPTPTKKAPSALKGIVAGVVVVALAAVGYFLLFSSGEKVVTDKEEVFEKTAIKDVSSIVARKESDAVESVAKPKKIHFWEQDNTNGFTKAMMRKWRDAHMPPPAYTNNSSLYEPRPAYAIFKYPCENRIACYLTHKPGDLLVGTPTFGKSFKEDFLKSLETPIVISEDDTEEQKALKRQMIETKIDLKARMDAGEDICKIMDETHADIKKLARYKATLEDELHAFKKDKGNSLQDVEDFLVAANKMLEAKGIAPLTLSPISKRMLSRRQIGNR